MKGFAVTMTVVFTLLFGIWATARMLNGISFDIDCGGHLKRAGDANSIGLAKEELTTAVKYLEDRKFTQGNTGIIWQTPKDDVAFWYRNLRQCLDSLESLPADATELTRTNVLMKLRETLLDHTKDGTEVTCPGGIAIFPHNVAYCLWALFSGILACAFGVLAMIFWERY